jgi:hypothetical protein
LQIISGMILTGEIRRIGRKERPIVTFSVTDLTQTGLRSNPVVRGEADDCILLYTWRFIMFSVITNIYNNKTKRPNLTDLFTATGKQKKFF